VKNSTDLQTVTDMNNLKPYSERTKYRKIAAQVARYFEEARNTNTDLVSASDPCTSLSDLSAELSEVYGDDTTDLNSRDLQLDSASIVYQPDSSKILESADAMKCDEVQKTTVVCGEGEGLSLGASGTSSSDDELDDDEFFEPSEWRARAIDSDDSVSDFNVSQPRLRDSLASWAGRFNISQEALSDLLHILHPAHSDLPLSAKGLLHTKRLVEIKVVSGGEYYYFGLAYWLESLLNSGVFEFAAGQLTIHVNIDGIPLFNSSNTCLWPILCSVKELEGSLFPAALYCSSHKPSPVDEYLQDFITEMQSLEQFGFKHSGKRYSVKLGAIICDAPARAFVKCIKSHSGYNCCERCRQRGEWLHGRLILPDLDAPRRTDASFISVDDAGHHVGVSPFTKLQCGMVAAFPLDYMHLVCLGVVRRLINQWMYGHCWYKLSQGIISAISDRLVAIQPFIPREFSRKPRSLLEHKLWKATELRLFLLYTGPVILKGFLAPEVYSNFLDLSVSIRILLSPHLIEHYLEYSNQLLRYFVKTFCSLYGKEQLVYNIHSLVHLCDDVKQFGALDNVSAFPYESFLGRLIKLVRRPQQPCAQLVRRLMECPELVTGNIKHAHSHCSTFAKPHMEGPITISLRHCQQYKQCNGKQYFISTNEGDNCFEILGKIGLVRNILKERVSNAEIGHVLFEEFEVAEPFFTDPLDSRAVSVYFVSKLSGIRSVYPLNTAASKYVLLPYKHGFVALKEMHQC